MIKGVIGGRLQDYVEKNMTCLEDCNGSNSNASDCTDVECSTKVDINGNPYQCLSEEEAQNWHKKCLPSSENYCRYTGKVFLQNVIYILDFTINSE
jgi:hypothetical protein